MMSADITAEEKLLATLARIATYIRDGGKHSAELLSTTIDSYDKTIRTAPIDEAFFIIRLNASPALQAALIDILNAAQIKEKEQGRYKNAPLTVYELLVELNERYDGVNDPNNDLAIVNAKIKEVIEYIDDKYSKRYKKISLAGVLVLLGILVADFFCGITPVQELLTITLFFPAIQLATAVGIGFYRIYQTMFDRSLPWFNKIRDNFFILAATGFKISAYLLVLTAAVTGTPVVAILTVVAQGLIVFRELFKLIQIKYKGRDDLILKGEDLEAKQHQARFDSNYEQHKKSLWASLCTALLMTGIVALWCFYPAGIAVTIGAIVSMGVVYAAEWYAKKQIVKNARQELKAEFKRLEDSNELNTPVLDPSSALNIDPSEPKKSVRPQLTDVQESALSAPVAAASKSRASPLRQNSIFKETSNSDDISALKESPSLQ